MPRGGLRKNSGRNPLDEPHVQMTVYVTREFKELVESKKGKMAYGVFFESLSDHIKNLNNVDE